MVDIRSPMGVPVRLEDVPQQVGGHLVLPARGFVADALMHGMVQTIEIGQQRTQHPIDGGVVVAEQLDIDQRRTGGGPLPNVAEAQPEETMSSRQHRSARRLPQDHHGARRVRIGHGQFHSKVRAAVRVSGS